MRLTFNDYREVYRRLWVLGSKFGRRRVATSLALSIAQGLFQVIGITSVLPFLLLASDPERFRATAGMTWILTWLPPVDTGDLLLWSGLAALTSLVLSNAINLMAEYVRMRYAHDFGHWLRMRLLRAMMAQPYGYFLDHNTTTLLRKVMSDTVQMVNQVLLPAMDSIVRVMTMTLLFGLLFFLNPAATLLIACVLGGFYVLFYQLLMRRRRQATESYRTAHGNTYHGAHQLLAGIKPIRVHGVEGRFLGHLEMHSGQLASASARIPIFGSAPRYVVESIAFGAAVLLALVLSRNGNASGAVLTQFAFFAAAGYRLLPALQAFYSNLTSINLMRPSLDEIWVELDVLERPSGLPFPPVVGERLAWVHGFGLREASYGYPNSARVVLAGITFEVPKNACVGIMGTTGAGKTTLIDLILGLHVPTSGHFVIDGQSLAPRDVRRWQGAIGYVPQDIFLLDASIRENIALGLDSVEVDETRLREAARAAQILDFIERDAPQGFETRVGERGVRLSGGQRQRIGIARALYRRPDLLVFDEATNALDFETERALIETIQTLHGSLTMVIISHRPEALVGCDELFLLEAGKLRRARPGSSVRLAAETCAQEGEALSDRK